MVKLLMTLVFALGAVFPLCIGHPVRKNTVAEESLRKLAVLSRSLVARGAVFRRDGGQSSQNNEVVPTQGCRKLVLAWKKVQTAVRNSDFAGMLEQVEDQLLTLHGVDINDEAMVTLSFCALADIDSLQELAEFVHSDVETVREKYDEVITSLNAGREAWESIVDSPYVSASDARVLRAIIQFFNELENIGLLTLS